MFSQRIWSRSFPTSKPPEPSGSSHGTSPANRVKRCSTASANRTQNRAVQPATRRFHSARHAPAVNRHPATRMESREESTGFLSATPRTLILRGIDLARAQASGSDGPIQPEPATVDDRLARDLRRAELWSLVLTATALLLTYRSIPVAVATFAFGAIVVAVTWGVLTLAAQAISLPFVVVSVASLLALALGADLASLAYATWRSGGRSTGRAAAIACCGVLAAFLPLAVLPPSGLRAIVVGAATAAAVAYAGSRTAIPSAIHLVSRWVQPSGAGTAVHSGPIARAAGAAARAPLVTLVIVIALLLPLCVAGFGELRAPKSTVPVDPATTLTTIRTSLASDTERVLRGTIEFVIDEPRTPETIAAIAAMLDEIAQRPAFSAPVFVQWSVDGQVAVVTAFVTDERELSALQAAESVRDASPLLAPHTVIGGPVMLGAQIDDILRAWSLWSSVAATLLAFLVLAIGFHALLLAALAIGGAAASSPRRARGSGVDGRTRSRGRTISNRCASGAGSLGAATRDLHRYRRVDQLCQFGHPPVSPARGRTPR